MGVQPANKNTNMAFKDDVDAEVAGGYFKFREGDNRIRILSEPIKKVSRFKYGICYDGAPYCQAEALPTKPDGTKEKLQVRFTCYVLNRATNAITIADLPIVVAKALRGLMDDADYAFDTFPMPYDINVKAKGAGTMNVEYSVVPSRKEEPLTADEQRQLDEQTPMEEVLEVQKNRAKAKHDFETTPDEQTGVRVQSVAQKYPSDTISPDDIPF